MKTASFVYYGQLSPPSEELQRLCFSYGTNDIKQSNSLKVFYLNDGKKVLRDNSMGSFFFPTSSSNTARALRFLEWVQQTSENYYLMMYGIENKDYIIKDGYPSSAG